MRESFVLVRLDRNELGGTMLVTVDPKLYANEADARAALRKRLERSDALSGTYTIMPIYTKS